jgi:MFS transporter, ACS family, D-galactonate transporter
MTSGTMPAPSAQPSAPHRATRRTELDRYPAAATRYLCLGIVVVATIVLYYQFYLAGAVAAGTGGKNGILPDYNMSFVFYVNIAVVGYILGAVASFVSGLADRYGRVNIVTIGLFIVALLCLLGIPLADSKVGFAIVFGAIGLVEGVILVATPALVRDFSPQLGRASAMGFWTLGPVLGSLVVSIQISSTSVTTPWHDQYIAAGIVGLVVAALSALFLRELTPELRDQLMVSSHDRALVEARAKGIDLEATAKKPFRQMLKPDIILSAFAISVFLIIYYVAVGFFPAYFQTIFGFSQSKANSLGNWIWAFDALALLVIGWLSDKIRVRKPFMVVGAIGAIAMTIIFLTRATHPETSYTAFAVILSLLAVFLGVAYAPWMASFTETVEQRNPALVATGLAVWGLVIRIVIAISVFIVPHVVTTVSTLVEKGAAVQLGAVPGFTAAENTTVKDVAADPTIVTRVQAIAAGKDAKLTADQNAAVKDVAADPTIVTKAQTLAAQYKSQLATAAKIKPATQQALAANPADQATQAEAVSEISGVAVGDVAKIITLNAQHGPALAAAQAVDQATITTLLTDPTDQAAGAKAVGEIVAKLKITPADALSRLNELKTIPVPDLLVLQSSGTKVVAAAAQLTALAKVPPADLAFLTKYGPPLQDPKVQADLLFLQKYGGSLQEPKVQSILTQVSKAAAESPKQWQHYFWIAVGGEIVFIPLIFLLAGYWSPRRARKKEEEHEAFVQAELAKLSSSNAPSA